MAAEIGDVAAAGTIEAAWGNSIRDRAVMRYASSAARDSAETGPTEGRICYLEDANDLQIYNGSGWVSVLLADGTVTPTTSLPMGSNKITGLAAATTDGDATRYEQTVIRSLIKVNSAYENGGSGINWSTGSWDTGDSNPAGSMVECNITGLTTGIDYLFILGGMVSYKKSGSSGTATAQDTRIRWDYNDGTDSMGSITRTQVTTDFYKQVAVSSYFSASSITGSTVRAHLLEQNEASNTTDYTWAKASVRIVAIPI